MKNRYIVIIFIITYSFFSLTQFIYSQPSKKGSIKLRIDQTISKGFPDVEVYVSVTKKYEPLLSLVRGNFTALVDGEEVDSKLDVAGFQYTEEGIAYSLVLAVNGLMEGEPMDEQLKAAIVLVESLRAQDRLSVYTFGNEVKTIFEFEKKSEDLLDMLSKIKILGGNPYLYDVLAFTARRFDKTSLKRKIIIIMSDGREKGSKYTKDQLFSIIDEKSIPVYSIGLKLMAGHNLYRIARISNHTGGEYIFSGDLSKVSRCMSIIQKQILQGYCIKFEVDNIKADNQYHQLQIRASYKGREATFFKNYIATKVPISFWVIMILIIISIIILTALILWFIFYKKKERKNMGITKRKCSVCKQRMKDDWDECIFCKYLPPPQKKLKKKSA